MQQVVMRLEAAGPHFELRDNPTNRAPLSFEDKREGIRIPRLGSQDILGIAQFAIDHDFTVDTFYVEDHTFTRVPEKVERKVTKLVMKALARGGAQEAARIISEDWSGYFVTGVVLTTPDLHTISLLRQGVTRTSDHWRADTFLTDAWQAVHFS